ncbi:HEAT repeat domain-containing protein [Cerasicoccus fimbriatus]|uniref:HEAT repeat domain-containing protein n=1 Tax=Cerasicoccus fimbriatus TaxID=3014554 RepID=UPI0022B3653B|nr:HEAT repeat domain-containing protein [Cerasicoccus sp. TK19100]
MKAFFRYIVFICLLTSIAFGQQNDPVEIINELVEMSNQGGSPSLYSQEYAVRYTQLMKIQGDLSDDLAPLISPDSPPRVALLGMRVLDQRNQMDDKALKNVMALTTHNYSILEQEGVSNENSQMAENMFFMSVKVLSERMNPAIEDYLLQYTSSPIEKVRISTMRSLADNGSSRVIPKIEEALKNSSGEARKHMAYSLQIARDNNVSPSGNAVDSATDRVEPAFESSRTGEAAISDHEISHESSSPIEETPDDGTTAQNANEDSPSNLLFWLLAVIAISVVVVILVRKSKSRSSNA